MRYYKIDDSFSFGDMIEAIFSEKYNYLLLMINSRWRTRV